ncbi:MAG: ThiF family adenylyltransferase [Victivallaceae bacterium]
MSRQLINHSPDLRRLVDEGYDIEIKSNYLLVKNVPYVTPEKKVAYGILVSSLDLAGDITTKPHSHVVRFGGHYPCNMDGTEITQIKHQTITQVIDEKVTTNYSFSNKPREGYTDYYHKMTTYIAIISGPAEAIDDTATAKIFPVIETDEQESVFMYRDNASSRVDINLVTSKLELGKVAIVGLGGTGSYILDLVAKTPVRQIFIFDGDRFLQHNAFRTPGAPAIEELRAAPFKVDYLKGIYSKMHRNIVTSKDFIDETNVDQLKEMDFVFLCIDKGCAKKLIIDLLEDCDIPFIDVGMGVERADNKLFGLVRVTTSSKQKRNHIQENNRISFSAEDGEDEYSSNIQIADLNSLNAALAVIKWKKLFGFYADLENEHHSLYTIDGNILCNEDRL